MKLGETATLPNIDVPYGQELSELIEKLEQFTESIYTGLPIGNRNL